MNDKQANAKYRAELEAEFPNHSDGADNGHCDKCAKRAALDFVEFVAPDGEWFTRWICADCETDYI